MSAVPNLNTYILTLCAIVSAITPVMLALLSRAQRATATAAAVKVESVRQDLQENKAMMTSQLEGIHQSVNGDRRAMLAKMDEMHAEILKLTTANINLQSKQ